MPSLLITELSEWSIYLLNVRLTFVTAGRDVYGVYVPLLTIFIKNNMDSSARYMCACCSKYILYTLDLVDSDTSDVVWTSRAFMTLFTNTISKKTWYFDAEILLYFKVYFLKCKRNNISINSTTNSHLNKINKIKTRRITHYNYDIH